MIGGTKLKKIKYLILVVILLIIIIFTTILIRKNGNDNVYVEIPAVSQTSLEKETMPVSFIQANNLVSDFFAYIAERNENMDNKEAAYNILDKKYADKNNITLDNILNTFSKYKNYSSYSTKEMYTKEINQREGYSNIYVYMKGIIRIGGSTNEIYILMRQDYINSTYSIEFLSEFEYNEIFENSQVEEENFEITDNGFNMLYDILVTDYDICLNHMEDFSDAINNNPEEAYYLLNEEYRNKRFKNINEFEEYINQNLFKNSSFKEYLVNNYENYDQYICKDAYENIYIFTEKYPMQYTVILDTYTLDLPEFLEQYNSTNNQGKTALNIQKIIQALNAKDYTYVYNHLADSFKNNYFKTEEDFEKYAKSTFFSINKAEYGAFSVEGDVNTYEITLTDQTGEKTNQIKFNVIMQLKEGTDFVMSFGS